MKTLSAITDPVYSGVKTYSKLDRFFVSLLRDERDLPFIYLTLKITFTLVPLAVFIYMIPVGKTAWWLGALIYFFLNRSEEHTSELQSRLHLVCRLLLE